jgi:hypothetical protein
LAMVDVSGKAEIFREATATGTIKLKVETVNLALHSKNRRRACSQEDKRSNSSLSSVAFNKRRSRRKSI